MKKAVALILALVLVFALAGCSKGDSDKKSDGVMTGKEYLAAAIDDEVCIETVAFTVRNEEGQRGVGEVGFLNGVEAGVRRIPDHVELNGCFLEGCGGDAPAFGGAGRDVGFARFEVERHVRHVLHLGRSLRTGCAVKDLRVKTVSFAV